MKKIVPLIIAMVLAIGIGAFAVMNYSPTPQQQPSQTTQPTQPTQPEQPSQSTQETQPQLSLPKGEKILEITVDDLIRILVEYDAGIDKETLPKLIGEPVRLTGKVSRITYKPLAFYLRVLNEKTLEKYGFSYYDIWAYAVDPETNTIMNLDLRGLNIEIGDIITVEGMIPGDPKYPMYGVDSIHVSKIYTRD